MLPPLNLRYLPVLGIAALLVAFPPRADAQSYPPSLTDEEVAYARAAVDSLKQNPRGPYSRLRWFCRDGTVHPPQGTPCRDRGGGNQHAEWNETARRLSQLNLSIGTILQATDYETFLDVDRLHDRLKQYLLEDYLVDTQDGWALRRARTYRGARQAEDEEARGTEILVRLLSRPEWVADHYWLASQAVAAVPHIGVGGPESHYRIRNLATEVAQVEPDFQPIRVRIHSFPSRSDLEAVERYLERPGLSPAARTRLIALREALRQHYDQSVRAETLAQYSRRLQDSEGVRTRLDTIRFHLVQSGGERETLRRLAELSGEVRNLILAGPDGRRNLLLMDLQHVLQDLATSLASELTVRPATSNRRERIRHLRPLLALAHAGGFLSGRERDALVGRIEELSSSDTVAAAKYRESLSYLGRALDWATSTVQSALYPALERYARVEPQAGGYVEAAVRGSALLPFASELTELVAGADSLLGTSHSILGESPRTGLRGLNAGVAVGPLRVVDDPRNVTLDASAIYVMPETTTEMTPVAGVMTRDAGNLLSHVQLLSRNLGIPNASVPEYLMATLRGAEGRPLFYAVSPLGRVVLKDTARLSAAERSLLARQRAADTVRHRLDTSRLRLDASAPISLRDLRTSDAGVLVGPKAANLGQLASVFPDRVSEGVALPFAMFRRHVDRPMPSSERTAFEELAWARGRAAEMRRAGRNEEEIDRFMFGVLDRVRTAILELPWKPELRGQIVEAIRSTFGSEFAPGVFVRSDTNVEDLPQFSGAGLNLTVPNQQSVEDVLAAVKRVWTSPFTERAYLWRKQILEDWGEVYPSVLLQRSVPSEKSGVVITSGLEHGGDDALTVATGEGVGGAVDGESAETLVVGPDGRITLLSQARAATRQLLDEQGGGTRIVPARRPEHLLGEDEIRELARVVRAWEAHAREGGRREIWDIEFGFAGGKLWLFQARPFVRFRDSDSRRRLDLLDREAAANANRPVPMDRRH